ncbi:replicative DNA helicase [Alkalibaculum sp. M08DMB]|uniref:Replicative DNA helicase n=1 Tax=Alkalibaculum sporogenes TaxID=2655001 RepID=A0A6A7K7D9_9FIRM|nr:replicative DNA helicase [Alkalibaculum sporogenes]MPW25295.1 replicative DNA helicase [Alkalibaculum sporogenes]
MDLKARVPPYNLEAEQSVIGSMLLSKDAILSATEIITDPMEFYNPQHQEIYSAIVDLFKENKPVDLITLSSKLKDSNTLERVGGVNYLTELVNGVPSYSNVKHYCNIVQEKALLRELIKASSEVISDCYEASKEPQVVLEKAEKKIFDISQKQSTGDFVHIQQALVNTLERIEEVQKNNSAITGVSTGFRDLDNITAGLQKTDLILIAARPSMGKTALALNIAQNAAVKGKNSVAVFSLEMSKELLTQRMLCCEAHIDSQKLRTGNLDEKDWQKLAYASSILSKSNIFIDDTAGVTVMEMRSKCRRLKLEHGLDMILIDYLQLMEGSKKTDNRQQEISEISRSLKALAREMNCPVVALSQLSRAPDARADHKPILSDLRESGAIEQDADVVMLLFRNYYYSKDPVDMRMAELNIAKQRNGSTRTIELAWLEEFTQFADYDNAH